MARLSTCGFGLGSNTNGVELSTLAGNPVQSTIARNGTYACRINSLSSGVAKYASFIYRAANGNGPDFLRVYMRPDVLPSAANRIIVLANSSAAAIAFIKLNADGTLQLADEDGDIGSPSEPLVLGQWVAIELKGDASGAGSTDIVEARLNHIVFATASNRNLSTGFQFWWIGGNLANEAQTTGDWTFDDVALNDNTGSFETGYPGPGNVAYLRPNADGDNTAWPTGSGYLSVMEVTPDDATSFVGSTTSGQAEDYNLDSPPLEMASAAVIKVVHVGVRFRRNNSTQAPQFACYIKAASGGTTDQSTNIAPNQTPFQTNAIADPRLYPITVYDLPGASTTPWAKSDLESAQIGVIEANTTSLTAAQVTTIWLVVEYVNPPPRSSAVNFQTPGVL